MRVVAGFFGTAFIYILLAMALRAALRRIMENASKAERIAYVVALIPTMAVAWYAYGLVTMVIVAFYIGGVLICDFFDKKNTSDTPGEPEV